MREDTNLQWTTAGVVVAVIAAISGFIGIVVAHNDATAGGDNSPSATVPAPPSVSAPAETAAESSSTGIAKQTPAVPPAAESSPAERTAHSALYLDVDGSLSQYKAGPGQYRADHDIKFTVHVSDDVGEVDSGCYAKVTALQAGSVIKKDESACSPGWGWINLHPGTYTLRFDVTTDWGAKGSKSVQVGMVP